MRYRLRTLLIVLAIGPPVLWIAWLAVHPSIGLWEFTQSWLLVFSLVAAIGLASYYGDKLRRWGHF